MAKKRRPSLKRLYADLRDAPPNVASIELTEAGFRVTFFGASPAPASMPLGSGPLPPPMVKGTPFPDDGSPINVADLTLSPISLDEDRPS